MAIRRPTFSVFSMSFLDVISCGFGAVLLVFLMVSVMSAANVSDRNVVSIRLRGTPIDATGKPIADGTVVPLRAIVIVPSPTLPTPFDKASLLAMPQQFDLRLIAARTAAQGRVSGPPVSSPLCTSFYTNLDEDDVGLAVLRGVRPRMFWVVFTVDQLPPEAVASVRFDPASLAAEGSIERSATRVVARLSSPSVIDSSSFTVNREDLIDFAIVVEVHTATTVSRD